MSETRTILVIMNGNKRRKVSNIPSDAKITYAPVQPGSRDYNTGNALRIYTSKENQLAVFTNVQEFRDLTLKVQEQTEKVKAKRKSETNSDGSILEVEETVELEWEDVD